jgi:hypothetical protein
MASSLDSTYFYEECLKEQGHLFNLSAPHPNGTQRTTLFPCHIPLTHLHNSQSDEYWMIAIGKFFTLNAQTINIAYGALLKSLSDGATLIDWNLQSSARGLECRRMNLSRYTVDGVNSITLMRIIEGLETNPAVLIIAEGQLYRVILAMSHHLDRMYGVMIWMIIIFRLGGSQMLTMVIENRNSAAMKFEELKNCAGVSNLLTAYMNRYRAYRDYQDSWMLLIMTVGSTRKNFIGDICFEASVCGVHPPGFDHVQMFETEDYESDSSDECEECTDEEDEEGMEYGNYNGAGVNGDVEPFALGDKLLRMDHFEQTEVHPSGYRVGL